MSDGISLDAAKLEDVVVVNRKIGYPGRSRDASPGTQKPTHAEERQGLSVTTRSGFHKSKYKPAKKQHPTEVTEQRSLTFSTQALENYKHVKAVEQVRVRNKTSSRANTNNRPIVDIEIPEKKRDRRYRGRRQKYNKGDPLLKSKSRSKTSTDKHGSIFTELRATGGSIDRDVKQQWEHTVEIMASRGPCKDPLCQDCRWPRAENPRIDCVTARVHCPTVAAKFAEHVQVVYYDHALQHTSTITGAAYALLAAVIVMYLAGRGADEFVDATSNDFSRYPIVSLTTFFICIGIDLVMLVFLWGVQGRCWQDMEAQQKAARQSRAKLLPIGTRRQKVRKKKCCSCCNASSKFISARKQATSCHDRAYEITRAHMQLFQVACLLPVIVATNTCIFFLYFGKFQVQREFFTLYFDNMISQIENGTEELEAVLEQCDLNDTIGESLTLDLYAWLPPSQNLDINYTLWNTFIGENSTRGLETIKDVSLEVLENHVEVGTFVFLVGAKLLVLFLMVVHHSGFWYVLAVALLNDLCVIIVGLCSISSSYASELTQNMYFWVWLLLFVLASFPMVVSFTFLERRAVQLFLIMLSTAEDNLRASRPNIVSQCLYVDQTAKGKIGAGGSGQVFRGRYAGFEVAVKELFTANIDHANRRESFKEAEVLSRVRHPNIVTFYGINISQNRFQLCTELCADSLDRVLNDHSVIFNPLEHKDIKPGNILFKLRMTPTTKAAEIHVKIADFGLAKFTANETSQRKDITTPESSRHLSSAEAITSANSAPTGTIEYMPPEALRADEERLIRAKLLMHVANLPAGRRRSLGSRLVWRSNLPLDPKNDKERRATVDDGAGLNTSLGKRRSSRFCENDTPKKVHCDPTRDKTHTFSPDTLVPFKWDAYSFGTLLWQLHSRRSPFSYVASQEFRAILKQRRTTKEDVGHKTNQNSFRMQTLTPRSKNNMRTNGSTIGLSDLVLEDLRNQAVQTNRTRLSNRIDPMLIDVADSSSNGDFEVQTDSLDLITGAAVNLNADNSRLMTISNLANINLSKSMPHSNSFNMNSSKSLPPVKKLTRAHSSPVNMTSHQNANIYEIQQASRATPTHSKMEQLIRQLLALDPHARPSMLEVSSSLNEHLSKVANDSTENQNNSPSHHRREDSGSLSCDSSTQNDESYNDVEVIRVSNSLLINGNTSEDDFGTSDSSCSARRSSTNSVTSITSISSPDTSKRVVQTDRDAERIVMHYEASSLKPRMEAQNSASDKKIITMNQQQSEHDVIMDGRNQDETSCGVVEHTPLIQSNNIKNDKKLEEKIVEENIHQEQKMNGQHGDVKANSFSASQSKEDVHNMKKAFCTPKTEELSPGPGNKSLSPGPGKKPSTFGLTPTADNVANCNQENLEFTPST